MNSSGMKRGLAATAISALAVTGLPFLATSASATPIADTLGAGAVDLYGPADPGPTGISAKNDGTNTTVSLVAGGGASVTSVLFQYSTDAGVTWVDVPGGNVARNADGVFAVDWSNPPATTNRIRAVAGPGGATDSAIVAVVADGTANTVELASEGSLGVFQEPYAEVAGTKELLGVTGTVSQGSGAPTITNASHGTGPGGTATIEPTTDTASENFNAVVDIDGYPYSGGAEGNQIALNAATSNTDDAEGSTLYVQTIGSITATPATQEKVDPSTSEILITVLDTTGKPVAGAQVFKNGDTDDDGAGADEDTDGPAVLLGYTNGRGQIVDDTQTTAGEFKYYVNTTDTDVYEPAVDKRTSAVTVTTYTPTLATVDIVNTHNPDRANFDLDELIDGDDFIIETRDQRGNLYNEPGTANDVEYRWVIDPSGTGPTYTTTPWTSATPGDNGDGTFDVAPLVDGMYDADGDGADDPLPEGTYTLEARRPNVSGTGLTNATPETFKASESEITFAEGNAANAPVNGTFTVTGKLANDDGGLAGRLVRLSYAQGAGNDAAFAPQSEQPAGVDVSPDAGGVGSTATVVTDADGNFSVKLKDPAVPANVTPSPESGNLRAIAEESATDNTSLQGNNGVDDPAEPVPPAAPGTVDNAEEYLTINWRVAPVVSSIDIAVNTLDPRNPTATNSTVTAGPGVPVDLDISVFTADGNDLGTDPDAAADVPVEVTVDKGFLSPNAESANDVTLDADHDDAGDLWGFLQDDGQSQDLQTGDTGANAGKAGIVAAIEKDAGFDDDGMVQLTVTVKAGNVTETETITMDSRVLTNLGGASFERAAGEPSGNVMVGDEVDFQLYTMDQFGNLAGDELARVTDDSTVADFRTDEDFDQTLSDFTTSGPGVTAFSDGETVQTLTATMQPGQVLVNATGDPVSSAKTVTESSDPINWVAAPTKENPGLVLKGRDNGGKADRLKADARGIAAGAEVNLFKKTANGWKKIREGVLNAKGNMSFKVADKNGKKKTTYKAVVKPTADTTKGVDKKTVR